MKKPESLARSLCPISVRILKPRRRRQTQPSQPQQQQPIFGEVALRPILSAVYKSSPELLEDSSRDWTVSALDAFDTWKSKSRQQTSNESRGEEEIEEEVWEGKGMMRWALADKKVWPPSTSTCNLSVEKSSGDVSENLPRLGPGGGGKDGVMVRGRVHGVYVEDLETNENDDDDDDDRELEVHIRLISRPVLNMQAFLAQLGSPVRKSPSSSIHSSLLPAIATLSPIQPSHTQSMMDQVTESFGLLSSPTSGKRSKVTGKIHSQNLPVTSTARALFATEAASTASTPSVLEVGSILDALVAHTRSSAQSSQLQLSSDQKNGQLDEATTVINRLASVQGATGDAARTVIAYLATQQRNSTAVQPSTVMQIEADEPTTSDPYGSSDKKRKRAASLLDGSTATSPSTHQSLSNSTTPWEMFQPENLGETGQGADRRKKSTWKWYEVGCFNCGVQKSSVWMSKPHPGVIQRANGDVPRWSRDKLCNACGQFFNKNGVHRTILKAKLSERERTTNSRSKEVSNQPSPPLNTSSTAVNQNDHVAVRGGGGKREFKSALSLAAERESEVLNRNLAKRPRKQQHHLTLPFTSPSGKMSGRFTGVQPKPLSPPDLTSHLQLPQLQPKRGRNRPIAATSPPRPPTNTFSSRNVPPKSKTPPPPFSSQTTQGRIQSSEFFNNKNFISAFPGVEMTDGWSGVTPDVEGDDVEAFLVANGWINNANATTTPKRLGRSTGFESMELSALFGAAMTPGTAALSQESAVLALHDMNHESSEPIKKPSPDRLVAESNKLGGSAIPTVASNQVSSIFSNSLETCTTEPLSIPNTSKLNHTQTTLPLMNLEDIDHLFDGMDFSSTLLSTSTELNSSMLDMNDFMVAFPADHQSQSQQRDVQLTKSFRNQLSLPMSDLMSEELQPSSQLEEHVQAPSRHRNKSNVTDNNNHQVEKSGLSSAIRTRLFPFSKPNSSTCDTLSDSSVLGDDVTITNGLCGPSSPPALPPPSDCSVSEGITPSDLGTSHRNRTSSTRRRRRDDDDRDDEDEEDDGEGFESEGQGFDVTFNLEPSTSLQGSEDVPTTTTSTKTTFTVTNTSNSVDDGSGMEENDVKDSLGGLESESAALAGMSPEILAAMAGALQAGWTTDALAEALRAVSEGKLTPST